MQSTTFWTPRAVPISVFIKRAESWPLAASDRAVVATEAPLNAKRRAIASPIAIVDDDISVQSALQDLIESDGLSTVCFGSAEEFLASGAEHKAGCLIADIRMPGMSGIELQAKLKANRCRIPVVFITAHGDARMRIQAMRDGAVEFLTKPFDNAVLLETVHAAVEDYSKTLRLGKSNQ